MMLLNENRQKVNGNMRSLHWPVSRGRTCLRGRTSYMMAKPGFSFCIFCCFSIVVACLLCCVRFCFLSTICVISWEQRRAEMTSFYVE